MHVYQVSGPNTTLIPSLPISPLPPTTTLSPKFSLPLSFVLLLLLLCLFTVGEYQTQMPHFMSLYSRHWLSNRCTIIIMPYRQSGSVLISSKWNNEKECSLFLYWWFLRWQMDKSKIEYLWSCYLWPACVPERPWELISGWLRVLTSALCLVRCLWQVRWNWYVITA